MGTQFVPFHCSLFILFLFYCTSIFCRCASRLPPFSILKKGCKGEKRRGKKRSKRKKNKQICALLFLLFLFILSRIFNGCLFFHSGWRRGEGEKEEVEEVWEDGWVSGGGGERADIWVIQ